MFKLKCTPPFVTDNLNRCSHPQHREAAGNAHAIFFPSKCLPDVLYGRLLVFRTKVFQPTYGEILFALSEHKCGRQYFSIFNCPGAAIPRHMVVIGNSVALHWPPDREANSWIAASIFSFVKFPEIVSRLIPASAGADIPTNRILPDGWNNIDKIPFSRIRHCACANPSGLTLIFGLPNFPSLMRKYASSLSEPSEIFSLSGSPASSSRRVDIRLATFTIPAIRSTSMTSS